MHPQTHSADRSQAGVLRTLAPVTTVCMVSRGLLRDRDHPPVISAMLAGLALGLGVLGALPGQVFALDTRPYLMILATAVLALLMFVVRFEIDLPVLRKRGGAASVAAASVLLPCAAGMALIWWIQPVPASAWGPASTQLTQALFIGVAFSATAFPVLARVQNGTALKRLSIRGPTPGAAAARDVAPWAMVAVVVAMAGQAAGASTALRVVGFVGLALVLRRVLRPLGAAALARSSTAATNSSIRSESHTWWNFLEFVRDCCYASASDLWGTRLRIRLPTGTRGFAGAEGGRNACRRRRDLDTGFLCPGRVIDEL